MGMTDKKAGITKNFFVIGQSANWRINFFLIGELVNLQIGELFYC